MELFYFIRRVVVLEALHVDIRVVHFAFFFRIVGTDSGDRHFDTVDNRFQQRDERPDSGNTDAAGADETDLLGPDHLGKGSGGLAVSRCHDIHSPKETLELSTIPPMVRVIVETLRLMKKERGSRLLWI